MMQRLAIWIVNILEKKGALRSGVSRETYIYGFDIAIYTFLSTFGLFLIGWIADRPIETALLIFLYYTNQSSGGGFHASSHLMCFLTMVLGELLFLASFLLPYSPFTCSGISVISLLFMWTHPLVLHPNKSYLKKKAPQLIKRSRQILLLETTLLVAFILLNIPDIIQTGSLALLLSTISRDVPILKHTGIVDFSSKSNILYVYIANMHQLL